MTIHYVSVYIHHICICICMYLLETLERRYRDFVHLNNAQLGNSNPLTLDQMVTEITKRENAKDGNAKKGIKSVQIAKDLRSGKVSK